MMRPDKAAERQILKAQAEGKLKGIKGEGKPLDLSQPYDADQAGYARMAEEGVLPEELRLKAALEVALTALPDKGHPEYKSQMANIADLQMRYEIAREARRKFSAS